MNKKGYLALKEFFLGHQKLLTAAQMTQKVAELVVYAAYPAFLLYLVITWDLFFIKSALVCGAGFLAVSLLRARLNAKRPYEVFGEAPLIKKETKGRSFPSRHAFSAAIISVSVWAVFPVFGAVLFAVALIIATLRVLLGVHFIKDVLFGILCGVAVGAVVLL